MMRFRTLIIVLAVILALITAYYSFSSPDKTLKTSLLEKGAALLQRHAPPGAMDIYLVAFHPLKHKPNQQMIAHHYCNQLDEEFAQCAIYDGNTKKAKLVGIEFIISEALYNRLPSAEQSLWHPHNYEILSGQLLAPGIPAFAEHQLMKQKMNSYGKTWHVWHGDDTMPSGQPELAWSFNFDGEANPGLIETRDSTMQRSTPKTREARSSLVPLAYPQQGVNSLRNAYKDGRVLTPIMGVKDSSDSEK